MTDAVNFFFEALDQKLFADYLEICNTISRRDQMRTKEEGETFTSRALLVNSLTQDHLDIGDWWGGLAAILPAGSFQGTRNLIEMHKPDTDPL